MRTLRLGTRGSDLALAQSGSMARALEARHPGLTVELVRITTSGDRIQDVPLGPSLGQAFFTKEIQDALLEGRVDLAVHSCKDLATSLPEGTVLAAIPPREDVRDALVSRGGGLMELAAGARVGTSSMRRKLFVRAARPDLEIVELRGNVPTRVGAVEEGRIEAAVLAMAGLRRLGLEGKVTESLDPSVMLPAAAQGALALEVRASDEEGVAWVSVLDDGAARAEVTAERSCLHRLEAGCQAPVGALGRWKDGILSFRAAVAGPEGIVWTESQGDPRDAEAVGAAAAEALLGRLGVSSLRHAEWAGPPPSRREDR
ncbi:MAG TPA: hydroxymethylbilane synthase [Longimicrobiales bacterium]|nr:hydroxymethylbilane synthase [Longimicrobiales bacterium]